MQFEPVIGLEVHAELETLSKMFCACPVVDPLEAKPNTAVCPICAGMPGVLPVINQRAVEYSVRVVLALDCQINLTSIFARKNYFYPDLPKGYQISQYEQPLARHGKLLIQTAGGEKLIRIRRVHIEEDTGKLTHISQEGQSFSLLDLNRAGIPLLEIVTEPDMHSAEEVRLYAQALRALLRYLGVNSGEMHKGNLRIEPNVSIRRAGSEALGTRVEIKNLNSFRALERSVDYEIERQSEILRKGGAVRQETLGWDAAREATFTQRVKEGEEDYRYFPEPDLPPLVLDPAWIEEIRHSLPELPATRQRRFQEDYHLNAYNAGLLVNEQAAADYYEQTLRSGSELPAKLTAHWISGELFALLNQSGQEISTCPVSPAAMAGLLHAILGGRINQTTAKTVLGEMFVTGQSAESIIASRGLQLITDTELISDLVARTLANNPEQVARYLKGKETISHWLFGQVIRQVQGQANAQLIHSELDRQLNEIKGRTGNA